VNQNLGDLPLLPTTTVGSHGIPGWVHLARDEARRGTLGSADLAEVYDDATKVALLDQERAGVDVVTDGEMRRLHFIQGFYEKLTGLRALGVDRRLGAVGYDQVPGYAVDTEVSAPVGLGIVAEFRFARGQTKKPLKATCPGPLTLTLPVKDFGRYENRVTLAYALAQTINGELKALVDAGATFIQLDEPSFSYFDVPPATMAELINLATAGINAKLALHVCFGNFHGHPRTSRSYRRIFPGLLAANVDQFVLEYSNREMAEIDLWQDVSADRELAIGVVDVKSYYPESASDVADRIRLALRYVPAEKLWITSDCGFNHTPRHSCVAKLNAMVGGTRIVRQELAGR
jgi:5-methyltetrahydropteroyltriglutamate--homocysteine methyltransferase